MKCRCSSDDYLSLFCESSNGKEHARSRVPCWRSVRSENQEDWRPSCAKSKSRVRDEVTTRRQKAKITAPVRYPVVLFLLALCVVCHFWTETLIPGYLKRSKCEAREKLIPRFCSGRARRRSCF